jgi:lipopolysaccharide transport system permease protein
LQTVGHTGRRWGGALISIWSHRQIIRAFVIREIAGRYRGSFGGLLWSLINPLLMLTIYTFVFAVVFKARWSSSQSESGAGFAVILFVGLIVHGLFSECLLRAPRTIIDNTNFVKKLIFPLEVLPIITLGVALFHAGVSILVLFAAMMFSGTPLHVTAFLLPLVLLPLIALTLGLSWFVAALGVYIRDIGQLIGLAMTIILFLSPVFYPISSLPEPYRSLVLLNPLTLPIEQSRNILIWGRLPDWTALAGYYVIALAVASFGYWWFQKSRRGFADVL